MASSDPLRVSVVIPTYNRAAIVGRAVESVLVATRPGDEILVVDDGSTDDTAARIGQFGDRVRYLASPHLGPGASRNLGIREARMPLVAFLDSDDLWMPDKLELQRTVMEARSDVLFCFSDFAHRTRSGVEIRCVMPQWHFDARGWDEILGPGFGFSSLAPLPAGRPDFLVHVGDMYPTQMLGDYVCTSTVIVRRAEAGDALYFPEDLRRYQDWECFGRLAQKGLAAYLDCETQWNCDHAGPRQTGADELFTETAKIRALERLWGNDPRFLAQHGQRYREELASHRRTKARALLALGRTQEARAELRLAGGVSLTERILTSLPGPFTRAIIAARRRLRRQEGLAPVAAHAGRTAEGDVALVALAVPRVRRSA